MAHRADEKYLGTVTGARLIESAGKGTPGLELTIEEAQTGDMILHTIWLSPKSAEYAARDLETLGVTEAMRKDASFWSYKVSEVLPGTQIEYGTRAEEWKGKTTVKVAWIGKPRASSTMGSRGLANAAAALFGGEDKPDTKAENLAAPITDDEIPFGWFALLPLVWSIGGILS